MQKSMQLAARWACLGALVVLLVGIVAAPLVFSEAVVAHFLVIIEALARASS